MTKKMPKESLKSVFSFLRPHNRHRKKPASSLTNEQHQVLVKSASKPAVKAEPEASPDKASERLWTTPRSTTMGGVQTDHSERSLPSTSEESEKLSKAAREFSSRHDATPKPSGQDTKAAIGSMNKATRLLYQVINALEKKTDAEPDLRELDALTLDQGIQEMRDVIRKLVEARNLGKSAEALDLTPLKKLGHVLESVCKTVAPFVKVFLAVGVHGSAVTITL
jgi:hypothetical protein